MSTIAELIAQVPPEPEGADFVDTEDNRTGTFDGHGYVAAQLRRRDAQLLVAHMALENMLNHYVKLINSGDAGNWNPETEPQVIDARTVLAAINPLAAGTAREAGNG